METSTVTAFSVAGAILGAIAYAGFSKAAPVQEKVAKPAIAKREYRVIAEPMPVAEIQKSLNDLGRMAGS